MTRIAFHLLAMFERIDKLVSTNATPIAHLTMACCELEVSVHTSTDDDVSRLVDKDDQQLNLFRQTERAKVACWRKRTSSKEMCALHSYEEISS